MQQRNLSEIVKLDGKLTGLQRDLKNIAKTQHSQTPVNRPISSLNTIDTSGISKDIKRLEVRFYKNVSFLDILLKLGMLDC